FLDRHAELAGDLGNLVVLEQAKVLGDDLLGWLTLQAEVTNLEPEALLEVARGDADRIEGLDVLERLFDIGDRPPSHRGNFLDRGDEVAVVVQVADDGPADFLDRL